MQQTPRKSLLWLALRGLAKLIARPGGRYSVNIVLVTNHGDKSTADCITRGNTQARVHMASTLCDNPGFKDLLEPTETLKAMDDPSAAMKELVRMLADLMPAARSGRN